ncbi:hypothetical protein BpHYR1_017195 [Brachionus plicatilis]|uniref:Uncharacterized protein n=1 Tax=Brachionus plicatilis TaxID=10195 RepID=A0A3M7QJU4_BRAPC|nr:hypothetical protein BpHYR1_017195 [Brachionus plicatilis]
MINYLFSIKNRFKLIILANIKIKVWTLSFIKTFFALICCTGKNIYWKYLNNKAAIIYDYINGAIEV